MDRNLIALGLSVANGISTGVSNVISSKEKTKQTQLKEKRKEIEIKESTKKLQIEKVSEENQEVQKTIQKSLDSNENIANNIIDLGKNSLDNGNRIVEKSLDSNENIVNNIIDLGKNSLDNGNRILEKSLDNESKTVEAMTEITKISMENLSKQNKESLAIVQKSYPDLGFKIQEILTNKEIEDTLKDKLFSHLIQEKDKAYNIQNLRKEVELIQKNYFQMEKKNYFNKGSLHELTKSLERYQNDFLEQVQIIKVLKQEKVLKRIDIELERLKTIEKKIIDIEFELLNSEKERIITLKKVVEKEKNLDKYNKSLNNYIEKNNYKQQKEFEEILHHKFEKKNKMNESDIIEVEIEKLNLN